LTNVNHAMRVMREETFGPVIAVMKVRDMEEAVRLANDSELGLTASVWSKSAREAEQLARRIEAGVVMVNDHLMSHGLPETPWGGCKQSGIGRTHGQLGFDEMTQPQCIIHDRASFLKKAFWWHPYGPEIYDGLKGMLELLYAKPLGSRIKGLRKMLRMAKRSFRS
jgi:succinate-semialdehyde dehydrogenase/glutarate-semialdehyde dehydrogenase